VRATGESLFPPKQSSVVQNDAAHIFVSEEIVARELQVVLRAFHVAEERVAAPAGKERYRLPL